jgi:hypothetical protein
VVEGEVLSFQVLEEEGEVVEVEYFELMDFLAFLQNKYIE